ncbi:MAG TPA: hypothetical protein VLY03_07020 [Bacteroidota bacterium]|nr:hypothetical protein [Bacteroidota bacterium]
MKTFFTIFLSTALFLEGCTSFSSISRNEQLQGLPRNNEYIRITLNDGSEIESAPYQHAYVTAPSDFVMGMGRMTWAQRDKDSTFSGMIDRTAIDSSRMLTLNGHRRYVCWLPGSVKISFREEQCLIITPDSGTGFWCIGTIRGGSTNRDPGFFSGKIPPGNIREIGVRELSALETAVALTACTVVVVGLAAATCSNMHFDILGTPQSKK